MPQNESKSNTLDAGMLSTTAPLTNVSLCSKAMMRAVDRPLHLPGFVCFYGPSGWGKTTAATYVQNTQDAYLIQCQSGWTRKAVLLEILFQMGIDPAKTLYEMMNQVCNQLADSMFPLIIDEMDHLVKKGLVELIRDIHDGSQAAILLIGEERLPQKLKKWERFHGRVLDWVPAQPADLDDCRHLADLYCREVTITDDLLQAMYTVCKGSARRIIVNIELIRTEAKNIGLADISLAEWGKRQFFTGEAPVRRTC